MSSQANIFGTPMSRALDTNSLTLLDVRAVVEWVHKNIENSDGDKENIMLWGPVPRRSPNTHVHTRLAEDPLVNNKFGILSQPGNIRINLTETTDPYVNFDYLAKSLGCNHGNDPQAEFECMQQVSFVQIEETVNNWNTPAGYCVYLYIPDEKYIFSNETERYTAGKVAKGPATRLNAAREIPNETNLTQSIAGGL